MRGDRLQTAPATTAGGSYFAAPKTHLEFFSTGSKLLDLALGGGWAVGRMANIIGDKSTGKTLLCIEAATNFARQYPKGKIRYRESEAAFDKNYAAALGLPLDRVDFGVDPTATIEDLYEELDHRVKNSKHPELIVVDSLDALSTRAELDRAIDAPSYGGDKAKMLSALFRRIAQAANDKNFTFIITSQLRDNIGALPFQKKYKRSGGHAMDHYATHILWLSQLKRLVKTVHNIKRPVGITIKAFCEKNKVGLQYREAQFPILFGYGIADRQSCLEWLKLTKTAIDINGASSLDQIHAKVQAKWYEIEQSFLPARRKYEESNVESE